MASNGASVTSTAASTSTVASVSAKAKRKAGTQKNTSSLTLQEENQMVDWLEDNPILWNTLMMDYKCRDKKKKLWEDQAALMGSRTRPFSPGTPLPVTRTPSSSRPRVALVRNA